MQGASNCRVGHPEQFDCDDHNAAVHPGAVESCDSVDNNCNGLVDDRCLGSPQTTKYHYNGFNQMVKSGVPMTCPANDTDCDGVADTKDNCPNVFNPGQEETGGMPTLSGVVGAWAFDESSGTLAQDVTGVHNGTLIGGVQRSESGRHDRALVFDGVDDAVTTTLDVDSRAMPTATFAAWVFPTQAPRDSRQAIMSDDDGG